MSRKSKQRDIQPIDQSKVKSDLNILFELLEKIREFLEDPDLFPHDIQIKNGKTSMRCTSCAIRLKRHYRLPLR